MTGKDEAPEDADQFSVDDEQPTVDQDRGPTSVPDVVPAGGTAVPGIDDPVDQVTAYLEGEYDEAGEAEILRNPRVRRLLSVVSEQTMEFTSGEIPPPSLLSAYEKIHPGAKEVFFAHHREQMEMIQAEQRHRHAFEDRLLSHNIESERRGQLIATSLALAFLIAGLVAFFVALVMDYENAAVAAVGAIIAVVAGLAGVFLGIRPKPTNQAPKRRELPPGDPPTPEGPPE